MREDEMTAALSGAFQAVYGQPVPMREWRTWRNGRILEDLKKGLSPKQVAGRWELSHNSINRIAATFPTLPAPRGRRGSRAQSAMRRAEVVRLRGEGRTFTEIAAVVGITPEGCAYLFKRGAQA